MTPTLVHRYAIPIREAIEALLGEAVGDCEAWRIRIEGDEVVVDVVAPVPGIVPTMAEVTDLNEAGFGNAEKQPAMGKEVSKSNGSGYDSRSSNEMAKSDAPAEQERKGDELARKAGIACNEKGFRTFLTLKYDAEVVTAADAATWVRQHCSVKSRADLDHEPHAAAKFREVDRLYGLWLNGYDV